MKGLFIRLLACLATSSLFADATLSVATVSPETLEVQIDGYSYFTGSNDITLANIYPGYHQVVVYGAKGLLFNREIFLRDGVHHDITINRFGTAIIDESASGSFFALVEPMSMGSVEFTRALSSLRDAWLSDRMNLAEEIINLNYFTTDQVGQMMKVFSFDDDRLSLAKCAYSKTVDTQNYYLLNTHFTFSSSKEDLAKFIKRSNSN